MCSIKCVELGRIFLSEKKAQEVGQIMRAQNFETVFGMQTSGRR
jgi:hypothetical protein